jgi:hypothetical protein
LAGSGNQDHFFLKILEYLLLLEPFHVTIFNDNE